ncbi:hypothetical protein ACJA25_02010 [Mycoplasmopsis hyopharyngis]|uniref:hypothetical protein n=1 Tax=Mycoplasmopsis hyopharyngis TaxID=29558 RepID=UPI0038732ACF
MKNKKLVLISLTPILATIPFAISASCINPFKNQDEIIYSKKFITQNSITNKQTLNIYQDDKFKAATEDEKAALQKFSQEIKTIKYLRYEEFLFNIELYGFDALNSVKNVKSEYIFQVLKYYFNDTPFIHEILNKNSKFVFQNSSNENKFQSYSSLTYTDKDNKNTVGLGIPVVLWKHLVKGLEFKTSSNEEIIQNYNTILKRFLELNLKIALHDEGYNNKTKSINQSLSQVFGPANYILPVYSKKVSSLDQDYTSTESLLYAMFDSKTLSKMPKDVYLEFLKDPLAFYQKNEALVSSAYKSDTSEYNGKPALDKFKELVQNQGVGQESIASLMAKVLYSVKLSGVRTVKLTDNNFLLQIKNNQGEWINFTPFADYQKLTIIKKSNPEFKNVSTLEQYFEKLVHIPFTPKIETEYKDKIIPFYEKWDEAKKAFEDLKADAKYQKYTKLIDKMIIDFEKVKEQIKDIKDKEKLTTPVIFEFVQTLNKKQIIEDFVSHNSSIETSKEYQENDKDQSLLIKFE